MVPSFTPQPVPVHTQLMDFPLFSFIFSFRRDFHFSSFRLKLYYYVKGLKFRLTLRFSFLTLCLPISQLSSLTHFILNLVITTYFPFRYYFTRLKVFVSFHWITYSSGLYSDSNTRVIHLPRMILSKLPSLTNLLNQICYDIICNLS